MDFTFVFCNVIIKSPSIIEEVCIMTKSFVKKIFSKMKMIIHTVGIILWIVMPVNLVITNNSIVLNMTGG
ncbi:hypothetical protein B0681_08720 [Moraxella porci DSM 25326]|uniref:Uncharacterized protein n=1 Tax=Moraxella porci DSM 25326 TaxID=573983 RepID=A0A1T0CNW7_9GAMM|nr:hypothetical protein B0681_08720 [Moraxella porci DSM 25326]